MFRQQSRTIHHSCPSHITVKMDNLLEKKQRRILQVGRSNVSEWRLDNNQIKQYIQHVETAYNIPNPLSALSSEHVNARTKVATKKKLAVLKYNYSKQLNQEENSSVQLIKQNKSIGFSTPLRANAQKSIHKLHIANQQTRPNEETINRNQYQYINQSLKDSTCLTPMNNNYLADISLKNTLPYSTSFLECPLCDQLILEGSIREHQQRCIVMKQQGLLLIVQSKINKFKKQITQQKLDRQYHYIQKAKLQWLDALQSEEKYLKVQVAYTSLIGKKERTAKLHWLLKLKNSLLQK